MPVRIIISCNGGVVQSIRADSKDVSIEVLDHDEREGADEWEAAAIDAIEKEYDSLPFQVY
ncbi:MAG: hypothetical protein KY475_13040 [Planctomycetes bacterium]|nr:hypothetical protein [Planctomycetota bacterium]